MFSDSPYSSDVCLSVCVCVCVCVSACGKVFVCAHTLGFSLFWKIKQSHCVPLFCLQGVHMLSTFLCFLVLRAGEFLCVCIHWGSPCSRDLSECVLPVCLQGLHTPSIFLCFLLYLRRCLSVPPPPFPSPPPPPHPTPP